ncbi:MAG: hypothetical protein Q8L23_15725 [Caulobacter sp.]|nr:hypothetical protein [Caulobacter sp.]
MAKPGGFFCTVETAAAEIDIDARVLCDAAVLGGAPQAYGPMRRVEGSDYRIMLNLADVRAWHAAGRPIADTSYREPWRPIRPAPLPPPPPPPAKSR